MCMCSGAVVLCVLKSLCWFKQIHRFVWREHVTRHVSFPCKWKIFFSLFILYTVQNKIHIFWQTLTKNLINFILSIRRMMNIWYFHRFSGVFFFFHWHCSVSTFNEYEWFISHETHWKCNAGHLKHRITDNFIGFSSKKSWKYKQSNSNYIKIIIQSTTNQVNETINFVHLKHTIVDFNVQWNNTRDIDTVINGWINGFSDRLGEK